MPRKDHLPRQTRQEHITLQPNRSIEFRVTDDFGSFRRRTGTTRWKLFIFWRVPPLSHSRTAQRPSFRVNFC